MSIQLALLKSGEEVIADIKEFRNSDDTLMSYFFHDPHVVKIKTKSLLVEGEEKQKHDIVYHKWMPLSKDTDIIVNKDWVVCITDPIEELNETFEARLNGRDGSTSGHDDGRESSSGSSGVINPTVVLNE